MNGTWQLDMRFAAGAHAGRVPLVCVHAVVVASAQATKRTRIRAGGLSAVGGEIPE